MADDPPNYCDLDHYCVDMKQKIGQGMFGIVYWGVDKPRGELVAIKECSMTSDKMSGIALVEMKALQGLAHENILGLRTVIYRQKAFWLVMDFCDMGQLDDYFKTYHPVHESTKVEFMTQMHSALTFMHTRPGKVVHRDIKPANVLIMRQKRERPIIKIADFGLAKVAEDASGVTQADIFMATSAKGNLAFMAPEMVKKEAYDEGLDIYGLGLLFLSMLQYKPEEPMFPAADPESKLVAAIAIGQAVAMGIPVKIGGEVPGDSAIVKDVKALIRQMTHPTPKTRITSKKSLETIEKIWDKVKGSLAPPPPPSKSEPPKSIKDILGQAQEQKRKKAEAQGRDRPRTRSGEGSSGGSGGRSGGGEDAGEDMGYDVLRQALGEMLEDRVRRERRPDPEERMRGLMGAMPLLAMMGQIGDLFSADDSGSEDDGELKVGDRVRVVNEAESKARELQDGYGGWNDNMKKYLGKEGKVASKILHVYKVKFSDGQEWSFNPAMLEKVGGSRPSSTQRATRRQQGAGPAGCKFKRLDVIRFPDDEDRARRLQERHGGWNAKMKLALGLKGIVHGIDKDGDIRAECVNGHKWWWNADLLTKVDIDPNAELEPGDLVLVSDDIDLVRRNQKGHGEWVNEMAEALGSSGMVKRRLPDRVQVEVGTRKWFFNIKSVSLVAKSNELLEAFLRRKFASLVSDD